MKKMFILLTIIFMFSIGIVSVNAANVPEGNDQAAGQRLTCNDFKDLTRDAWFIIRVAVPALLILFSAIDMGKAVMASDEKEVKKATDTMIKRLVIGVAIFLLPTVVDLIVGLLQFDSITACL